MTRAYRPTYLQRPGAPWLLDLFCGAGGASVGYWRAGFNVVGVDIAPQPRYPFTFYQSDAIEYLERCGFGGFAVIHASPPCQAHSDLQKQSKIEYPDFIGPTREALSASGLPYVIENVEGAPLIGAVQVCGAGIPGLRVIRHRLFESNVPLVGVPCPKPRHPLVFTYDKRKPHHATLDQDTAFVQVTGGGNCSVKNAREAMGIDWMTKSELNEAIPPAYSLHVGSQVLAHVLRGRKAAGLPSGAQRALESAGT